MATGGAAPVRKLTGAFPNAHKSTSAVNASPMSSSEEIVEEKGRNHPAEANLESQQQGNMPASEGKQPQDVVELIRRQGQIERDLEPIIVSMDEQSIKMGGHDSLNSDDDAQTHRSLLIPTTAAVLEAEGSPNTMSLSPSFPLLKTEGVKRRNTATTRGKSPLVQAFKLLDLANMKHRPKHVRFSLSTEQEELSTAAPETQMNQRPV
eukprot:CAMPEP_0181321158 /NCGR_PEP_ID=MMETSP1101-20121128/18520_1 /TAXON_ID=46948 /ORGANISM="Rhodomonas abbreviata, Strain Caron Lab Isolate" /LENGTH=206 /DNA_ID=CAMNT_0023428935 /DNA_START=131 /DNA_END=751 /DNA_ORIENTATION=+